VVKTGDIHEEYSFTLERENLKHVLDQIPDGMKVSVISVVGAFRTGKSFLLTFFLRYLHYESKCASKGEEWMKYGGEKLCEGNQNNPSADSKTQLSFEWRGGQERMTTGIMMWSEPFFRKAIGGEKIAVLLVDTQGMFDNETNMTYTASIFGLSTLISSHQIYNVEKRIQEDHLQQLALFSAYGKMALESGKNDEEGEKPFQLLEFLIRDWQSFEDGDSLAQMQRSMDEYLKGVIKPRSDKEMQGTREQIISCFEKIACFGFCYPGPKVTNIHYDGDIDKIDPIFKNLLNSYTRRVFGNDLEPKRIRGRSLTALELFNFVDAYVKLFNDRNGFPKPQTMLDATAGVNTINAKEISFKKYQTDMEVIAGPKSNLGYIEKDQFELHHQMSEKSAINEFDKRANIGRKEAIAEARAKLLEDITNKKSEYIMLNESNRPMKDLEVYFLPMSVAAGAFLLRYIADTSCSSWSDTCRKTSHGLSMVYVSIFLFILISGFKSFKAALHRISRIVSSVSAPEKIPTKNAS